MSEPIILKCPECQRRCQVRPRETPYKIRCKRCDSPIRVPASNDVEKKEPSRRQSRTSRSASVSSSSRSSRRSTSSSERSSSSRSRKRLKLEANRRRDVSVQCPSCQSNFNATEADYGTKVSCPLCNHAIPLADPFASTRTARTKRRRNVPDLIDGDIAPAPRQRTSTMPTGLMLYIDGVLTFPFQMEVIGRLATFAFLILLLDAMVDACVYSLMNVPFSWAVRGFGISTLLTLLMVGSYAAVTFHTIFEETAAGSKEVSGWIDFDKSEYFFRLVTIGWLFAISAVIGYLPIFIVNSVLRVTGATFPFEFSVNLILFPLGFLLCLAAFPFVAMSTFEQHNYLSLFSVRIFKSLFREWWSWGIVIFVTWAFFLPWLLARAVTSVAFPFRGILILSPYFAIIFFIYSRLMGRLAYKIAQSADWD